MKLSLILFLVANSLAVPSYAQEVPSASNPDAQSTLSKTCTLDVEVQTGWPQENESFVRRAQRKMTKKGYTPIDNLSQATANPDYRLYISVDRLTGHVWARLTSQQDSAEKITTEVPIKINDYSIFEPFRSNTAVKKVLDKLPTCAELH